MIYDPDTKGVIKRRRQALAKFIRKQVSFGVVDAISTAMMVVTGMMVLTVIILHYYPR